MDTRGPDTACADLDRAVARMKAASADMLSAVAQIDVTKRWIRDGATSITAWLCARYQLVWATASEWVRVAHALTWLPRTSAAYRAGRLSWDQLRALIRFATSETDARLAGEAPRRTAASLWEEAVRHLRVAPKDAEEAHRRRFLSLRWDPDAPAPVLDIEGRLGAEQGAALEAALQRRSEKIASDPQAEDPAEARMADALVEAACGEPEPTTVVVHASADVLAGRGGPSGPWLAETENGRRLANESIRRMACDGRIQWVVASGNKMVGIGRRSRQVPDHIGRALRFRDSGMCRFPGCHRRRWLNAHHLVHWADGGGTDLDNLVLLCHAHHRLLHEGGWRTSGHPGNGLRFIHPRGQPLAAPT